MDGNMWQWTDSPWAGLTGVSETAQNLASENPMTVEVGCWVNKNGYRDDFIFSLATQRLEIK